MRPVDIQESGTKELLITWQDGHHSSYSFPYLRRKCPCAGCVDEWTGKLRLLPETISEEVRPLAIRPVGNYAIRFDWSDGHTTGIYSFEYLRSICACKDCGSVK